MNALLVDKPEISIVENDNNFLTGIGGCFDCRDDLDRILISCGVTRGVVREIKNEKLFLTRLEKSLLKRGCIKRTV